MAVSGDFLPPSERILYQQNPLVEVICQVRFPTILRIESDTPSDFQEAIRHRFPLFERSDNPLKDKIPPELLRAIGTPAREAYGFVDADSTTKISLASTYVSISTNEYVRWEQYVQSVALALDAFAGVYKPSFYSRIGLRYQNILQRSEVGLDAPWSQLLRPEISAELTIPEWQDRILEVQKMILCQINEEGDFFRLHHGLAEIEGSDETCYLLDFDYFYDERTETGDVSAIIDRLHGHSGRAFRWAITETLHNALGPQPG